MEALHCNSLIILKGMVKSIYRYTASRTSYDGVTLFFVLLLFGLLPFHHIIGARFSFYREVFALLFVLLSFRYMLEARINLLQVFEFKILLLWVVYLVLCYIIDPGDVNIYGDDELKATIHLETFSRKDYVMRNALVYLPLFLMLILRGMSKKELSALLFVVFLSSPVSICSFYYFSGIFSLEQALANAMEGYGIAYNTYIPYITFPIISGLFLYNYIRATSARALILCILLFDIVVVLLNQSRQSALFIVIAFLSYSFMGKHLKRFILVPFVLIAICVLISFMGISPPIVSRYLSASTFETGRFEIMIEGISMLDSISDWVYGKGLSFVIYSGPHNNYIRVIQRIGIVGMLLTFIPFIHAFFSVLLNRKVQGDKYLAWFVSSSLLFTLFHSFFGYPHDDAFNAPYVWLGLAIGVIYQRGGFKGNGSIV